MITEQERADFEAWMRKEHPDHSLEYFNGRYTYSPPQRLWEAYQAGRAALQSQDREDAERLDWLDHQARISLTGVSIDYVYDAQGGYVNEKGYRFMRYRFIGPLGKTAREAIDHARRVEGERE